MLADLPPIFWVAISLIPTLTTLISFLLWELIIWQTRSWHIYLPIKQQFHRFLLYSDSSYLADLLVKWWFHRLLPWQLTSLRAQHLADQVMADLNPPSNGNFTDSCEIHISFLLWELNIWQTRSWQIYPPSNGNFTDSCSTLRAHIYQTPCQMVISQIPVKFIFHSYSESSTFDRPSLGTTTTLLKGNFTDSYSSLRAHIW